MLKVNKENFEIIQRRVEDKLQKQKEKFQQGRKKTNKNAKP